MTKNERPARRAATRSVTAVIATCALAGGFAACGDDDDSSAGDDGTLTVYSGREEEYVGPLFYELRGGDRDRRRDPLRRIGRAGRNDHRGGRELARRRVLQPGRRLPRGASAGRAAPAARRRHPRARRRALPLDRGRLGRHVRPRARGGVQQRRPSPSPSCPTRCWTSPTRPGRAGSGGRPPTARSRRSSPRCGSPKAMTPPGRGSRASSPTSPRPTPTTRPCATASPRARSTSASSTTTTWPRRSRRRAPTTRSSSSSRENGDVGALVNVAGAGILEGADGAETGAEFIEFVLDEPQQEYFADTVKEYPLVAGVEADPTLIPLAEIEQPDVNLADLGDLKETLTLIEESGALIEAGAALARLRAAAGGRGGARPPAALLLSRARCWRPPRRCRSSIWAIVVADNWSAAIDTIWRGRTAELIVRSLGLTAAVTAAAIAIAVPARMADGPHRPAGPSPVGGGRGPPAGDPELHRRLRDPLRRWARTASLQDLLSPLGVTSLPSITGFAGAWLVLTLFTYPFALLPVRAALRGLDPQLEEAALGMGRSPTGGLSHGRPATARAGDRGRRPPGGALRAERLRRGLDHAVRLVHDVDLHALPSQLRPDRRRRAGGAPRPDDGRPALAGGANPAVGRAAPERARQRPPRARGGAGAVAVAGARVLRHRRAVRPRDPRRGPGLLVASELRRATSTGARSPPRPGTRSSPPAWRRRSLRPVRSRSRSSPCAFAARSRPWWSG